jgi:hypothetical protein
MPAVRNGAWVQTPIDGFVLAKLEQTGLAPAPRAERHVLLRRLYLDLLGLPPTPQEQRAFLADSSPDALEKVVDGLLARPEYGQRWARHWLDAVRYAESNGYERDGAKPQVWRYRDYVIDSLNRDKPYDQFVLEQLAGDELEGSSAETQIATTFLRLGTWDDEPAEFTRDRYEQLDDMLSATATVFLGLTLRCARCHDHKFEPLTQRDYYQTLAVFEPLKRPQEVVSATHRKEFDRLVGTEQELRAYHEATQQVDAQIAAVKEKLSPLETTIRERLFAASDDSAKSSLPPEAVAAFREPPDKRSAEQKKLVEKFAETLDKEMTRTASDEERAEREGLRGQIGEFNAARPKEPPRAYTWYEDTPQAPETHIFKRGDPDQPLEEVLPAVPAVLAKERHAPPQPAAKSTGRRLWFARWMISPDNPLTARVMVNRIWQHHFGEGLVATENDFGVAGEQPSHPELLDWLAAEFMANGWRLKPLHRMLVLSSTYQQATANESATRRAADVDPANRLLWRWRQLRVESEVVRDSILAVSGQLNAQMSGPSVFPPIARAVLEGQSKPGDGWHTSEPWQASRRSIYIFVKRSLALPELEIMDAPDTTSSCEQRTVSTVAPQALTLLNGEFVRQQARHFAARLVAEAGADRRAQVERAFELALCRLPRPDELEAAVDFLNAQQRQIESDARDANKDPGDATQKALDAFCLVLLNANEFVYVE